MGSEEGRRAPRRVTELLAELVSGPGEHEIKRGTDPAHGPEVALRLEHRVEAGVDELELSSSWPDGVPDELADLWRAAREVWLFQDVEYGQWGLHLLDPSASAERTGQEKLLRPADFAVDDIVIGEFLGDSDLVVMNEAGAILIAPPLDARADWPEAAGSLGEFLATFLEQAGTKYWEGTDATRS